MSDPTRRTIRTILQTAVALAAVLPAVVEASGIPAALPWVAAALAIAGALTRVMALPGVQGLLPRWLRTGTAPGGDGELLSLLGRENADGDRGRP
ncbi:hypothetical protein AB0K09_08190 [Streptomyces sp. NPDC049577]|uniref:hypothetical protein n=1 Tax=Streptomyces sp. NPDC049577 TaxID=3155153 RepID=UPI00341720BB